MQNSSRTRNSIFNVITSFGMQILVILLKFVTRTVFIHVLGKSYLGINGLFTDILTMLSLSELGFDTAINFKLYKPIAEKNITRIRQLMKFYRQAYICVGFTILILGLGITPLLKYFINGYEKLATLGINASLIFILYLMQSVSSYLFFAYKSAIVKADQRTYLLNIADCIVAIVSNIAQILILWLFKNFVLYTASFILFNILQNFVEAKIAEKFYPDVFVKEEGSIRKEEIIDLFKDCGALFVYKVNGVVLKATDNLVLSAFIGLSIVGMYSNYLMFYTAAKQILQKLYSAVKASMGNLFAVSSVERQYKFFEVMNFITVILYGTAGVGIAVLSNDLIVQWIGKDYLIAQPFSILIGIEVFFVGLKDNLGQVRNVTGIFKQMWYRPLLGIIINLGVSILLVQVMGIYGVLIGTIASDCLTYFMVDPIVIHKYSFNNYMSSARYYKKNIKYFAELFLVGICDYYVLHLLFHHLSWFVVILEAVITGLSVPLFFLLIYHNTEECKYLLQVTRRIGSKILKKK